MLESLEAMQLAYDVAKAIYDQVQLVKANESQFKRLAERIRVIENSIRGIDGCDFDVVFTQNLQDLHDLKLPQRNVLVYLAESQDWFFLNNGKNKIIVDLNLNRRLESGSKIVCGGKKFTVEELQKQGKHRNTKLKQRIKNILKIRKPWPDIEIMSTGEERVEHNQKVKFWVRKNINTHNILITCNYGSGKVKWEIYGRLESGAFLEKGQEISSSGKSKKLYELLTQKQHTKSQDDKSEILDLAKSYLGYTQKITVPYLSEENLNQLALYISNAKLDKISDSQQFKSALEGFYNCLEDCLLFIEEFRGKEWCKRVLFASSYQKKFEEINKLLEQSSHDLNLGLNVQQIMNREQDREDRKNDRQDIMRKQDEIIRLNEKELRKIQKFRRTQHKDIEKQLEKQLASMKDILESQTKQEPPPPIDPHHIIPFFDVKFDKIIGKGSFGTVFLVRWCEQPMAVKTLEGDLTKEDREQFIREVQIMSRLRSPTIVQFYGACLEPGRACLAMEYMEQGSLYDLLGLTVLTPEQKQSIALDVTRGLHFLHTRNVLHRDLKSANVLINKNGQAKITDFGLSKIRSASVKTIQERSEAIQWMAPETFSVHPHYTERSDIYSFGTILWELMTGQRPYANLSNSEIISRVTHGSREEIPYTVPEVYANIIRQCWADNPLHRANLLDIIQTIETYIIRPPSPCADDLYAEGMENEKQKNYEEARKIYERAAGKGHSRALAHLGVFSIQGLGVRKDKQQAYQYFLKAAESGHVRSQFNLATMLEHGDGIPRDIEQAKYWYKQAADQGEKTALNRYQILLQQSETAAYNMDSTFM